MKSLALSVLLVLSLTNAGFVNACTPTVPGGCDEWNNEANEDDSSDNKLALAALAIVVVGGYIYLTADEASEDPFIGVDEVSSYGFSLQGLDESSGDGLALRFEYRF